MALIKSKKFKGVYLNHLSNNDISYYITYRDTNGKHVTRKTGNKSYGMTEEYCNIIRSKIKSKIKLKQSNFKQPVVKKKTSVTLDSLAQYYFSNKNTKSLNKFKGKYFKRIQPILGKMDIANLSTKILNHFRSELAKSALANQTINCYMDIISAIISFAIKERKYSYENPVLRIKKLKVDNKREKILSIKEVNELLESVKDDWILNLFTRLSLSTGARKSTVLNIKKCDIDLEMRRIKLKDFKNNSTYYGFFCDDILYKLVKNRMKQIDHNDFIVNSRDYKNIEKYISRKMSEVFYALYNHKLINQNDRKNKVVIHTLRHTVLSHLAMNGESIYTIKAISNHKSTQMLDRYVKLSPNTCQKPIENLWKNK